MPEARLQRTRDNYKPTPTQRFSDGWRWEDHWRYLWMRKLVREWQEEDAVLAPLIRQTYEPARPQKQDGHTG